jgi:hypothetical protein
MTAMYFNFFIVVIFLAPLMRAVLESVHAVKVVAFQTLSAFQSRRVSFIGLGIWVLESGLGRGLALQAINIWIYDGTFTAIGSHGAGVGSGDGLNSGIHIFGFFLYRTGISLQSEMMVVLESDLGSETSAPSQVSTRSQSHVDISLQSETMVLESDLAMQSLRFATELFGRMGILGLESDLSLQIAKEYDINWDK